MGMALSKLQVARNPSSDIVDQNVYISNKNIIDRTKNNKGQSLSNI